jgi:hypothetical protein
MAAGHATSSQLNTSWPFKFTSAESIVASRRFPCGNSTPAAVGVAPAAGRRPEFRNALPHFVTFWTGRSLTIKERQDIEEDAHLPHAERGYGWFGTPSAHGRAALPKFARSALEMAYGVTTGGNDFPVT